MRGSRGSRLAWQYVFAYFAGVLRGTRSPIRPRGVPGALGAPARNRTGPRPAVAGCLPGALCGGDGLKGGFLLKTLHVADCAKLADVAGLQGLRLAQLKLENCDSLRDLSGLKGLPLMQLSLAGCPVKQRHQFPHIHLPIQGRMGHQEAPHSVNGSSDGDRHDPQVEGPELAVGKILMACLAHAAGSVHARQSRQVAAPSPGPPSGILTRRISRGRMFARPTMVQRWPSDQIGATTRID